MAAGTDNAATLRLALQHFDAGDVAALDALLAPDFLHSGNPLFRRDEEEGDTFDTLSERMASFAEHGITTTSRLIGVEEVAPELYVATMALHAETADHEGFSMLAGVLISFDEAGRIDHIHTHDTPATARAAAAEGCCEAHRRQVVRRAAGSSAA